MSMLPTCPRCTAYVGPDWETCKICGFDPNNAQTHGSFALPKAPKPKLGVLDVVTGLITLLVIVVLTIGAVRAGMYFWEHRNAPTERQYFVTVPH